MKKKVVFIVGLQKSGTTLMLRILKESPIVATPFKSEGNDFWGNEPPFSPAEFPAGTIYQRSNGEMGHEIGEEDATTDIQRTLYNRMECLFTECPIIVNKNPYNTVRLPWLRKLFPESIIIAMVRKPIPNVFSLLKKHTPHSHGGYEPEDGWWGVKPRGWRRLVQENKMVQCSQQWKSVNEKLLFDKDYLDMIIPYQKLCSSPTEVLESILKIAMGKEYRTRITIPQIQCFDSEYKKGARLLSKNKYYRESGNLTTPESEPVEFSPFREEDIDMIESVCGKTESMMKELH